MIKKFRASRSHSRTSFRFKLHVIAYFFEQDSTRTCRAK